DPDDRLAAAGVEVDQHALPITAQLGHGVERGPNLEALARDQRADRRDQEGLVVDAALEHHDLVIPAPDRGLDLAGLALLDGLQDQLELLDQLDSGRIAEVTDVDRRE